MSRTGWVERWREDVYKAQMSRNGQAKVMLPSDTKTWMSKYLSMIIGRNR